MTSFTANRSLHILLVEDCDDHAAIAQRALSDAGYTQITRATSLSTCQDEISKRSHDAILLDLNMIDSNGIDTVYAVKGSSTSIPVVVLTTHEDMQLGREAITAGAQDYVPKGALSGAVLDRAIRYAIERQQIINQNEELTAKLRQTVTQLEEAREDALAACRAKNDFLAGMSHEIRTPLTAVLGFTDVALECDSVQADPVAYDAIDIIRRNGSHLLEQINSVLDAAKLDADAMTVEIQPVSIHEIAQDVVQLMSSKAGHKNIKLDLVSDNTSPALIDTDPTRLRQVLINLVGNAIKFTEAGQVTLCVSASTLDEQTHRVRMEVIDTGIGMTPEQLTGARNAKAFWQADTSTTRRFGGTGLGLWLSHSIVSLLNGTLGFESTYGEGTRCVFVLDAKVSAKTEGAAPCATKQDIETGLAGLHILVADDSSMNRRLIKHYLSKAGAEVTLVETGRQAVDLVAKEPIGSSIDLVLMDLHMPECDGAEATALMLAAGFKAPIIALTASTDQASLQTCEQAGCIQVLAKPIDQLALIDAIASHCLATQRVSQRQLTG